MVVSAWYRLLVAAYCLLRLVYNHQERAVKLSVAAVHAHESRKGHNCPSFINHAFECLDQNLLLGVDSLKDSHGVLAICTFFDVPANHEPDRAYTQRVRIEAQKRGLILLTCGVYGNVIRFLFPLTIEDSVFEEALLILDQVFA